MNWEDRLSGINLQGLSDKASVLIEVVLEKVSLSFFFVVSSLFFSKNKHNSLVWYIIQ